MRRFIILAVSAVLAMSLAGSAIAQKPGTGGAGPKPGQQPQGGRRMMGGDFMKELNLTAAQKTKVEAIFKKQMDASKALRNQKLTEDERRAKYKALRDATNKQIRAVLTAAQQKKWDEMRKKMEQNRGRFGGPGGPGGPPPGGKGGGGR